MSRYTAQEMRDTACRLVGEIEVNSPVADSVIDRASAMLLQAADAMEREERETRYEYAEKFITESVSQFHHDTYLEAKGDTVDGYRIVRREVGEWEEVK